MSMFLTGHKLTEWLLTRMPPGRLLVSALVFREGDDDDD
jgi:hypothetical protein